jgi:hypothetical protein
VAIQIANPRIFDVREANGGVSRIVDGDGLRRALNRQMFDADLRNRAANGDS